METKRKGLQHEQVLKATNQNFDTVIISQMTDKEKSVMVAVENILGYEVDPEQYLKAYKYTRHKLDWQGKLYGRTYGDEYLKIVTAESYEQQIFAAYTNLKSIRRLKA